MSEYPPYPVPLDALRDFLEELRTDFHFTIGIDQVVAVQELMLTLAATGRLPEDPRDLAPLLGPLVASSRVEQRVFRDRFRGFLDSLNERPDEPPVYSTRRQESEAVEREVEDLGKKSVRWRVVWAALTGVGCVALALGLAALLTYAGFTQQTTALAQALPRQPEMSPRERAEVVEQKSEVSVSLLVFAGLASLAVWGLSSLWWRTRTQDFLSRRARQPATSRRLRIALPPSELLARGPLLRAARELRTHEKVPSDKLDAYATVARTAGRGGLFTPVFAMRPELPEYLALIASCGPGDQQTRLISLMLDRLGEEGLFITRFSFQNDPRLCHGLGKEGGSVTLDELAGRFSRYRLWIFGGEEGMLNPFTAEPARWLERFQSWKRRTYFTLESPRNWGRGEALLAASGFQVVEANERGLIASASPQAAPAGLQDPLEDPLEEFGGWYPPTLKQDPRPWLASEPPDEPLVERCLAEVRDYLGEGGYYWLSACAIYPELQWELTFTLAHHLTDEQGESLVSLPRVTRLVRLPWFRFGYMPDWFRERLLQGLDARQAQEARRVLDAVLLSSLTGKTDTWELEIADSRQAAMRQLWNTMPDAPSERGAVGSPLRDQVFVHHMQDKLSVRLPRAWKRMMGRVFQEIREERRGMWTPRSLPAATAAALLLGAVVALLTNLSLASPAQLANLASLTPANLLGLATCLIPLLLYNLCAMLSRWATQPSGGLRAGLFEIGASWLGFAATTAVSILWQLQVGPT